GAGSDDTKLFHSVDTDGVDARRGAGESAGYGSRAAVRDDRIVQIAAIEQKVVVCAPRAVDELPGTLVTVVIVRDTRLKVDQLRPVTAVQRQLGDLFRIDQTAGGRTLSFKQRYIGHHGETLGDGTHFQHDVDHQTVVDGKPDSLRGDLLEPGL